MASYRRHGVPLFRRSNICVELHPSPEDLLAPYAPIRLIDRIVAKSCGAARLDLELATLPSLLTFYEFIRRSESE